jgi:hypothetical protein
VETSDAEREPEAANPADAADEALPLAALVATDLPAPTVIDEDVAPVVPGEPAITAPSFEPALADTAPVFAPEADAVPVMHVYDSPVLTAPAAAMAVADVLSQVATDAAPAAAPMMGQVQTSARAPLAALERFLRKVQARQLELRGQTVA